MDAKFFDNSWTDETPALSNGKHIKDQAHTIHQYLKKMWYQCGLLTWTLKQHQALWKE